MPKYGYKGESGKGHIDDNWLPDFAVVGYSADAYGAKKVEYMIDNYIWYDTC